MVAFQRLQHVSVPAPIGSHQTTRAFYGDVLGLPEKTVPSSLPADRLVWYSVGDDEIHVFSHDADERHEAAHICLEVDDIDALLASLESKGHPVERDHPVIHNRPRGFVRDPYGNLIELTEIRGQYD